jgi:hypothetical protein
MKLTMEIEAIDIPTMRAMSTEEYKRKLTQIAFIDHHDVVRSSVAEYPLATSKEQLDELIKYLKSFRERMS